jgi:large subunit ribosomal protein L21
MYAIIHDGGRQYRVQEGDLFHVDFRENLEPGKPVTFNRVLAVGGEAGLKYGTPVLEGASVEATVVKFDLGPKVVVQKFRKRKNSRRKTGHRQLLLQVKITKING